MTLIQSQGHQSYNENVDPEQDYTHAKFERSCSNGVRKKTKQFFLQKNVSYLP